jgi:HK97 family phage major capsid protein
LNHAHSLFQIKSIDAEQRVIEGFASTPELDRQGDSMDPAGAKFGLPMPLLWQHKADKPIGQVIAATVTSAGIHIRAQIAKGVLPFIDEAWALIKSGLVGGLSIDWNPLEAPTFKNGVARYAKWEFVALSTVTIPANRQASIRLIKSLDRDQSAASGTTARIPSTPGVTGSLKATSMNVSEQLTSERETLQTKSARLQELMVADETGGGLEADEKAEIETLTKEVETHTAKVARLSTLEAAQASQAKGLVMPIHAPAARRQEPGGNVQVVALPKGTLFTRVVMAVAAGRGSRSDAIEYAKRFSNTPEVARFVKEGLYQKADVGMSVLDSPGWGSQLVSPNTVNTEFVELLMPRTILGRVGGFDEVPFNIPIVEQTGGSTFNWVGEAAPKPVGELAFERTTMVSSKVAGIVVLSDELIRFSEPKAEAKVREDMIKQCAKFLDEQFIHVSVSAGASNPASITNGVSSPSATGTTAAALRHDLNIALANFDTANEDDSPLVIVMTPALARGISLLTTSLGVAEFPGMTPTGGTLLGYRVIVSSSVDSGTIVIFKPSEIFLADDGRVTLDASREATLDLSGSTSATFSLWQNNCVGLRAERWIRWQKKRDTGVVAIIDTAAYAPA